MQGRTLVVGVDPGYRNLALVALEVNNGRVSLAQKVYADVGTTRMEADIITKVWNVLDIERPFLNADYVVIETQNFGRRNTQPVNQGLAWLLASTALSQTTGVRISFMSSLSKFKTFQVPIPKRDRTQLKDKSIYLATKLLCAHGIAPVTLFETGKARQWEHLADAVNLAFAAIKKLNLS